MLRARLAISHTVASAISFDARATKSRSDSGDRPRPTSDARPPGLPPATSAAGRADRPARSWPPCRHAASPPFGSGARDGPASGEPALDRSESRFHLLDPMARHEGIHWTDRLRKG